MFKRIFVFEVQNRLRQPSVYVYFVAAFILAAFCFSKGALPVGEKEYINSPRLLGFAMAWISTAMMLVTSAIIGWPLYKDIEYNTKDYYLTYPITRFGYYWGRYFSSLLFVFLIGFAVMLGAFAGTKLGPILGLNDASRYGPNQPVYFLEPFLFVGIPNLVFTSSIFYGLVALTRNIKVIYSSGIILFLCYLLSRFLLMHTRNTDVICLADPFGFYGMMLQYVDLNDSLRNVTRLAFKGTFLINRIIWPGLGIGVLIISYLKFNFERFFSGKADKRAAVTDEAKRSTSRPKVAISFGERYNLQSLVNLTKTELLNIIRDNYFWIIISSGLVFLGFCIFRSVYNNYGIPNFPRTVGILAVFNEVFLFYIFFVILFYTGETIHRDRTIRYAFINDALPMPNWVLNGSKLLSLLILAACFSLIPLILGVIVQLGKGYTQLHLTTYLQSVFTLILPRFLDMVLFAYVIHVLVNNKFAAHGLGGAIWIILYFLNTTSVFNYRPLLYSYTPNYQISDMDGMGHMIGPVAWYNLYWLMAGACLAVLAGLFFYRGFASSFKERLQLAGARFDGNTRLIGIALLVVFLSVGSYVYYNVSYLNNYLTQAEIEQRKVLFERTLKRYANLPLPKVAAMKLKIDLFPDEQRAQTHGYITLINQTNQPVVEVLVDADGATDYNLKSAGKDIPFTTPLISARGKLNIFRPALDTADFRLYRLSEPFLPGDSLVVELSSSVFHKGFSNDVFSTDILANGTFFKCGLPVFGYDEDDELKSPYERKKYQLPPKEDAEQDDPEAINTLKTGKQSMLSQFDLTVSTSSDQIAIAPGELRKQWKASGRSYFHYVNSNPGMYPPFAIISGKYKVAQEHVELDKGKNVLVNIYYHPQHNTNIDRFKKAYRDGLHYYSEAYGDYPFKVISLAETTPYGPKVFSATSLNSYSERFGWNADFKDPNQFDYGYSQTAKLLAQQWWRFQVAPNSTMGSFVIPEGLSEYDSYVMMEHLIGKNNMGEWLRKYLWEYLYRRDVNHAERPLISADKSIIFNNKAAIVLYGLRDLIGETNMNAALREFKNAYALKKAPPYAGSKDLYHYLKLYTADSLQYYLKDTWEKTTFYNNRIISVKASPIGKNDYKVVIKLNTEKTYFIDKGKYVVGAMNDYVDIGVFAAKSKDETRRTVNNPLFLKRQKFASGDHTIVLTVKGKPRYVGIDPFSKLIDKAPNDNIREIKE